MDLADTGRASATVRGGSSTVAPKAVLPQAGMTKASPRGASAVAGRKQFAAMLSGHDQHDQKAQDTTQEPVHNSTEDGQRNAQDAQSQQQDQGGAGHTAQSTSAPVQGQAQAKQGQKDGAAQGVVQTREASGEKILEAETLPASAEQIAPHAVMNTVDAQEDEQKTEREQPHDDASSSTHIVSELQAALSFISLMPTTQPAQAPTAGTSSASQQMDEVMGTASSMSATPTFSASTAVMGGSETHSLTQAVTQTLSSLASMPIGQEQTLASRMAAPMGQSMGPALQALAEMAVTKQQPVASATAQPTSHATQITGTAFAQAITASTVANAPHEGGQALIASLTSLQGEPSSHAMHSSATVQPIGQGMEASVKAMSFQPTIAAAAAPSVIKPQTASFVGTQSDAQPQGASDSLFSLLVKGASQTGGQSLSSGGEQGGAANDHAASGHASQTDLALSTREDETGQSGLNVESPSFLGLVSSNTGASTTQPTGAETSTGNNLSQHQTQQGSDEAKVALMPRDISTLNVLPSRSQNGQAGTLNMTVMTSDNMPVHVQLNRSVEGLSSLALQGQDDGTTDALQKTHHILARQLDDAGLHAGMMKIDILPTEAGQGAHGGEQNMPQQQSPNQGQHQGQNQQGQATFQQAGGFLAGGDGGASHHQTAQQPKTAMRLGQGETSQQDDTFYNPTGTAGGASGGMGRLNISV
ncbi:hypothetical protein BG621_05155 [Parasaccharibacter apium]|nr:hypothetical protein BG621_05155 [Parasaccharibacter apium]